MKVSSAIKGTKITVYTDHKNLQWPSLDWSGAIGLPHTRVSAFDGSSTSKASRHRDKGVENVVVDWLSVSLFSVSLMNSEYDSCLYI